MELTKGQKVFVYKNLHKGCWSVKDTKSGLVVAHVDSITLDEPVFVVGKSGRERVLKEQRKNVHAGVRGYYNPAAMRFNARTGEATYNPYKHDYFYDKQTGEPVRRAVQARFLTNGLHYNKIGEVE